MSETLLFPMTRRSSANAGSQTIILLLPIIVLLGGIGAPLARAQTYQQDISGVIEGRPQVYQGVNAVPSDLPTGRGSAVEMLFSGAIRLYQETLSATDMHLCNFTPSCSRFAAASVREFGFVKGSLLAADRLERCHGLPSAVQHYPYDASAERYADPVENYSQEDLSGDLP